MTFINAIVRGMFVDKVFNTLLEKKTLETEKRSNFFGKLFVDRGDRAACGEAKQTIIALW